MPSRTAAHEAGHAIAAAVLGWRVVAIHMRPDAMVCTRQPRVPRYQPATHHDAGQRAVLAAHHVRYHQSRKMRYAAAIVLAGVEAENVLFGWAEEISGQDLRLFNKVGKQVFGTDFGGRYPHAEKLARDIVEANRDLIDRLARELDQVEAKMSGGSFRAWLEDNAR